jgi:hypothetical protein
MLSTVKINLLHTIYGEMELVKPQAMQMSVKINLLQLLSQVKCSLQRCDLR